MSALRLFTAPQTRGSRPHWVLEELEMEYELVENGGASPEEQKLRLHQHPLGRVPVLEDGDLRLIESAALCLYIAGRDPQHRLLAAPGTPERAVSEQWLFFLMTELEAPLDLFAFHAADLPAEERVAAILPWARQRFEAAARVVDRHLAARPFMVSDRFSIVDVVLACMMSWANRRDLLGPFANLENHRQRMMSRPVPKRLFATYPPS